MVAIPARFRGSEYLVARTAVIFKPNGSNTHIFEGLLVELWFSISSVVFDCL